MATTTTATSASQNLASVLEPHSFDVRVPLPTAWTRTGQETPSRSLVIQFGVEFNTDPVTGRPISISIKTAFGPGGTLERIPIYMHVPYQIGIVVDVPLEDDSALTVLSGISTELQSAVRQLRDAADKRLADLNYAICPVPFGEGLKRKRNDETRTTDNDAPTTSKIPTTPTTLRKRREPLHSSESSPPSVGSSASPQTSPFAFKVQGADLKSRAPRFQKTLSFYRKKIAHRHVERLLAERDVDGVAAGGAAARGPEYVECRLCNTRLLFKGSSMVQHVYKHCSGELFRCSSCAFSSHFSCVVIQHARLTHPTRDPFHFHDLRHEHDELLAQLVVDCYGQPNDPDTESVVI